LWGVVAGDLVSLNGVALNLEFKGGLSISISRREQAVGPT
jgi:hypothetical protein